MIFLVTGVAGSGKTTVGRALAEALGWRFYDADDLHSPEAVARMARGEPLTDVQRGPWLARVRQQLESIARAGEDAVIACSALRDAYRRRLTEGLPAVRVVFLDATRELALARLQARRGHFAGPSLLDSQYATLERPAGALALDAAEPVPRLVERVLAHLYRE